MAAQLAVRLHVNDAVPAQRLGDGRRVQFMRDVDRPDLRLGGGAFICVPLYMIAQDRFSEVQPVYWYFWIGLLMVIVVVFARGGVLGLVERLRR